MLYFLGQNLSKRHDLTFFHMKSRLESLITANLLLKKDKQRFVKYLSDFVVSVAGPMAGYVSFASGNFETLVNNFETLIYNDFKYFYRHSLDTPTPSTPSGEWQGSSMDLS